MTTFQILHIAVYIVLSCVPVAVAYTVRKRLTGLVGFGLVVVLSSVLMSGVVIVQWLGYDSYLEAKIAPLDRNGDGSWSDDEIATWSEEDHKYMDSYIGDGGRNVFAAIIFPVFSLAYSFIVASIYWLVIYIRSRRLNA